MRFTKETCINYFLISAHLSNSITSDNRDPNNALNSDMGVIWGLLCLHKHNQTLFLTVLVRTGFQNMGVFKELQEEFSIETRQ